MEQRDASSALPPESPFGEVRTPRLSVLHLMLWTFCSAADLSLIRAIYALRIDAPEAYQNAYSVVQVTTSGAVLAGAFVLVRMRVRCGPPMLSQPGHWLLVVGGAFKLLTYAILTIVMLLMRNNLFDEPLLIICFGTIYLFPATAYGFAAYHNVVLRWNVLFIGLVVAGLGECIRYVAIGMDSYGFSSWQWISHTVPYLTYLLLPGALAIVSVVDFAAGRRYDWLHWTGVAAFILATSLDTLSLIVSWFVR